MDALSILKPLATAWESPTRLADLEQTEWSPEPCSKPISGTIVITLMGAKGSPFTLDIVASQAWVGEYSDTRWATLGAAPLEEPWPLWVQRLPESAKRILTKARELMKEESK